MIIAIEGIDGAGKNTLVAAIQRRIGAHACTFPRYKESVIAQLAARALYGKMGDLTDSIYGMATLFALDRHAVLAELQDYATQPDPVFIDRYVASNAAYSAARAGDDALTEWVADLEFGDLGLPEPTLTVLLDTSVDVARQRAAHRESVDNGRTRDRYESDGGLQAATLAAYHRLAAENWHGQWLVVESGDTEAAAECIVDVVAQLATSCE